MFEAEYINMELTDGILFLEYRDELDLNLEKAREILKSRLIFQQDSEYPVFCDTSGIRSAEPEALEFLADEGVLLIRAVAFYTKHPLDNLLTEYFVRTYGKKVPAKVFNHNHQAILFLKPYCE
ncbi:DUF7793 family protein [Zunongwangia sp. HRR-M8]|uniref:DUF7793 family protein n=1 Tax=Zunongwangia sp. HRR-M8 TaxID=3015170 RepID=UPI0022DDD83E|nr:STAS/SEC14 domain-containing protein [Zunongwangia sp. HRR-M8]WBL22329.1 STAS/SEC14 domain-containing protein [Zunongwangia sp. HRR-M8]